MRWMLVSLFRGDAVDDAGGPDCWSVTEMETDHVLGGGPGPSWLLRGRFPGGVAQLALAFRGVPRLQCCQGGGTRIPEPGFTDGLDGGCGRSDGLARTP